MAVLDVGEQGLAHVAQAHYAPDDSHDFRGIALQAGLDRLEVGDSFGGGMRPLGPMRIGIETGLPKQICLLAADLLKLGQAE